MHIRKSQSTKFQLKVAILTFWTKLAQKSCFQSKTEKVNTAIQFCILYLVFIPSLSLNQQFWFFRQKMPKKANTSGKQKTMRSCMFCWCFAYGYSFFLTCTIFQIFFWNCCLENFLLEILGFLSPKLSMNDHFTMAKDSIYWCFGPRSYLNQVKSPFFV